MSTYPIILFFVLLPFAISLRITHEQFNTTWQCTNMCTDSNLKEKVSGKCAEFEDTSLEGAYNEAKIKEDSKCKMAWVYLQDDNGTEHYEFKNVGICHLSRTESKCITTGENAGDMVVWTRSYETVPQMQRRFDVCHPSEVKKNEL